MAVARFATAQRQGEHGRRRAPGPLVARWPGRIEAWTVSRHLTISRTSSDAGRARGCGRACAYAVPASPSYRATRRVAAGRAQDRHRYCTDADIDWKLRSAISTGNPRQAVRVGDWRRMFNRESCSALPPGDEPGSGAGYRSGRQQNAVDDAESYGRGRTARPGPGDPGERLSPFADFWAGLRQAACAKVDAAEKSTDHLCVACQGAGADDDGRHDAIFPYETSQQPLLRLLGTPPDQKRHLVFPG